MSEPIILRETSCLEASELHGVIMLVEACKDRLLALAKNNRFDFESKQSLRNLALRLQHISELDDSRGSLRDLTRRAANIERGSAAVV